MDLTDRDDAEEASRAYAAAHARAAANAAHHRAGRRDRAPLPTPANLAGSQILWDVNDFSPEWDGESGGAKVIISGHPRPGTPEGLYLCCVFGQTEVPAEQIAPGVLRCRAPPHPPGRVPFYISCLGGGKRPASDIGTFEFRDATSRHPSAKDRRAAEVRLATGVTERDFQMRLVHLLVGSGQGGAGPRQGGGGGGTPPGRGPGGGGRRGEGGERRASGPPRAAAAAVPEASPVPPRTIPRPGGGGSGSGGGGSPGSGGGVLVATTTDGGSGSDGPKPPKLHPGAAFARKAVAALGLNPSDLDALSDGDVAKTFKTALEARLRHAISAEAKALRARREKAAAAASPRRPGSSDRGSSPIGRHLQHGPRGGPDSLRRGA